jgi:hypothetical protein
MSNATRFNLNVLTSKQFCQKEIDHKIVDFSHLEIVR